MSSKLSALAARATPRRVLTALAGMAALLLGENLSVVPPGVPYMRRVTGGLNYLDFGFTPANHAHALLVAFGPLGRHAQGLLVASVDVLVPLASGAFGVLAILCLGRALFGAPGRWVALALVPVAAMLFDYAENASIGAALLTFPHDPEWLSVLLHGLTLAKFAFYAGTLLLVVLGVIASVLRRVTLRR